MYISLKESSDQGFRRWSDVHPRPSNDNPGDVVATDALVKPRETPRDPWLVPGVSNTL